MSHYTISGRTIILYDDEGLEQLLNEYVAGSFEELDEVLWYDYGVTLIDKRNG